jgi:hypothetical protein
MGRKRGLIEEANREGERRMEEGGESKYRRWRGVWTTEGKREEGGERSLEGGVRDKGGEGTAEGGRKELEWPKRYL